jgi:phage terminase large subunit-like protein
MKAPIKWTRKKVAELQEWEFPGGYSAHKTRGDCTFNIEKAFQAVNFGPAFLKHVKGEKGGKPIHPEPWQAACYANAFGWEREEGQRRYRTVYEEMGRGNGKSTQCVVVAGILLYIDDEHGADIYGAAGTRDQAREVFGPFKHNVLDNPALAAISQTYQNSVVRIDERTGLPCGNYKVITADADFQHGGSPHGIIFDEMHVQPTRDLWDVLQTGKIKRRQPLAWAITTAGFDRHSICYEVRKYAEQVRDGIINDRSFLPIIYAADPADDWTDPVVWQKANPNLGVSIRLEDIASECEKAKASPGYENTFKRLHLCIWTEQDVRWLSIESWRKGNDPLPDLSGEPCWCGLDLSTTTDLSAFAMAFQRPDGGYYLLLKFWAPQERARQRAKRDGVPYLEWAQKKFLTLTPGDVVDYDVIRADINALNEKYNIQDIAIDRWNAAQITTQLQGDGFNVTLFGQGYASMSPAAKEFEKLVIQGALQHGGNPVLEWMASNVAIEQDAPGNIKPSKAKSTERIDGIVAAVMAVGRAATAEKTGSVYDTRGIASLGHTPEPVSAATNESVTSWGGNWGDDDD